MNTDFKLQILHSGEIFATKEIAEKYIGKYLEDDILIGEPAVAFYGEDTDNPNVILCIGNGKEKNSVYLVDFQEIKDELTTLSTAESSDAEDITLAMIKIEGILKAVGLSCNKINGEWVVSYVPNPKDEVIGDAESIADALAKLSEYAQKVDVDSQFDVEDSESIALTKEDGVLKGVVKISKLDETSITEEDDNILGVFSDGLYAVAHLSYDSIKDQLTFITSGYDENGDFKRDANKEIVQLGAHTQYEGYNKGHNVDVSVDNTEMQISADVNISDNDNNILVTTDSGLFVKGTAANIKYKNTTVRGAIDDLSVQLDKKIETVAVRKIDDLHYEILVDGKAVGEEIEILNAVVLVGTKYDETTHHLYLYFHTEEGTQTVEIDLSDLVDVYEKGDGITIDDHKISIDLNEDANESYLKLGEHGLYVSGIDEAINEEISRAKAAENDLQTQINELDGTIYKQGDGITIDNHTISVHVNSQSETYLTVDKDGLCLSGIDNIEKTVDDISTQVEQINKDEESILASAKEYTDEKIDEVNGTISVVKENITGIKNTLAEKVGKVEVMRGDTDFVYHVVVDGNYVEVPIDFSAAVDTYTQGDGIAIDDHKISIDLNNAANNDEGGYLKLDNDGLYVSGVNDAIKDAAEAAESNAIDTANAYTDMQIGIVDNEFGTIKLEQSSESSLVYTLYVQDKNCGTINIPEDQFLKSVSYDETDKILTFVFYVRDEEGKGSEETVEINIGDLVDIYTNGDGLKLEDNVFSIKINSDSESYLKVDKDGLSVEGIAAIAESVVKETERAQNEEDSIKSDVSALKYKTSNIQDLMVLKANDSEGYVNWDRDAGVYFGDEHKGDDLTNAAGQYVKPMLLAYTVGNDTYQYCIDGQTGVAYHRHAEVPSDSSLGGYAWSQAYYSTTEVDNVISSLTTIISDLSKTLNDLVKSVNDLDKRVEKIETVLGSDAFDDLSKKGSVGTRLNNIEDNILEQIVDLDTYN